MTNTKKAIICAIMIAMCVVLPMAFHAIPNAGSIYLPMHIPVLLCGLVTCWPYGLLCGIAGPVMSHLITAMPGIGYLPQMVIELAAYGFISGLLMNFLPVKNETAKVYTSLIGAMLLGRVVSGISKALIFAKGSYSITLWVTSLFVTGLPGIIIQIIFIPVIYFALKKAKLI